MFVCFGEFFLVKIGSPRLADHQCRNITQMMTLAAHFSPPWYQHKKLFILKMNLLKYIPLFFMSFAFRCLDTIVSAFFVYEFNV